MAIDLKKFADITRQNFPDTADIKDDFEVYNYVRIKYPDVIEGLKITSNDIPENKPTYLEKQKQQEYGEFSNQFASVWEKFLVDLPSAFGAAGIATGQLFKDIAQTPTISDFAGGLSPLEKAGLNVLGKVIQNLATPVYESGKQFADEYVDNNLDLKGALNWSAQNPINSFGDLVTPGAMGRMIGSVTTSLTSIFAGSAVGMPMGIAPLTAFLTMYMLESGDQYRNAYDTLKFEAGLVDVYRDMISGGLTEKYKIDNPDLSDNAINDLVDKDLEDNFPRYLDDQIKELAARSSYIYGGIAGGLETVVPGMLGLLGKPIGKTIGKSFYKTVAKKIANGMELDVAFKEAAESSVKKFMSGYNIVKVSKMPLATIIEGGTEETQLIAQEAINKKIVKREDFESLAEIGKFIKDVALSSEGIESFAAGMLGGFGMGTVGIGKQSFQINRLKNNITRNSEDAADAILRNFTTQTTAKYSDEEYSTLKSGLVDLFKSSLTEDIIQKSGSAEFNEALLAKLHKNRGSVLFGNKKAGADFMDNVIMQNKKTKATKADADTGTASESNTIPTVKSDIKIDKTAYDAPVVGTKKKLPTKSSNIAEIRKYARENKIDLTGVSRNKASLLTAVLDPNTPKIKTKSKLDKLKNAAPVDTKTTATTTKKVEQQPAEQNPDEFNPNDLSSNDELAIIAANSDLAKDNVPSLIFNGYEKNEDGTWSKTSSSTQKNRGGKAREGAEKGVPSSIAQEKKIEPPTSQKQGKVGGFKSKKAADQKAAILNAVNILDKENIGFTKEHIPAFVKEFKSKGKIDAATLQKVFRIKYAKAAEIRDKINSELGTATTPTPASKGKAATQPTPASKGAVAINPETGKPFNKNAVKGLIDNFAFTTDPAGAAKGLSLDELYSIKDKPGIPAEKRKIYNKVFDDKVKAATRPTPATTKTSTNREEQFPEDFDQPPPDINPDFQVMSDKEVKQGGQKFSALTQEILDKLKNTFPGITVDIVDKILTENGQQAFGSAMGALVTLSKSAKEDTPPHEFAHIYFRMLINHPVMRLAIKRYSKSGMDELQVVEELITKVGLYYTNKMKESKEKNLLKVWLNKFWNLLKRLISGKERSAQQIANMMWRGDFKEVMVEDFIDDHHVANPEYQVSADEIQDDARTAQDYLGMFSDLLKENIPTKTYAELIGVAEQSFKNADNPQVAFDLFSKNITKKLNDIGKKSRIDELTEDDEGKIRWENNLRRFFIDVNSKLPVYGLVSIQPGQRNYRVNYTIILNEIGGFKKIVYSGKTNLVSGNKNPSHKMKNFMEDDYLSGKSKLFFNLVSLNEIVQRKVYWNKAAGEYDTYYRDASFELGKHEANVINKMFYEEYLRDGNNLKFVFGAKGSDSSSLIIGLVPPNIKNMTKEEVIAEFQKDLDEGLITEEHFKQFSEWSNVEHNGEHIRSLAMHRYWQQIKAKKYMLKDMTVQEAFNRLRIDFSEGLNIIGLGNSKIMLIDKNETRILVNGKDWGLDYSNDDYDGWLITSRNHLLKKGKILGRTPENERQLPMTILKSSIRVHSTDHNDYLGMKMLEQVAAANMTIYRGDEVVATSDAEGNLFDKEGNAIDMIGSNNEAKQFFGKFDRSVENGGLEKEDGFYKIHDIGEESFKAVILPRKQSKSGATYPVLHSIISYFNNNKTWKNFNKSVKDYFNNVSEEYLTDFFNSIVDVVSLRKLIEKNTPIEKMHGELYEYLKHDPDGFTLFLPTNRPLLVAFLNNKIFKDGLFKGRSLRRTSTELWIKPAAGVPLKRKEFGISVDNSTITRLLIRLYKKKHHKDIKDLPKGEIATLLNNFVKSFNFTTIISKQPTEGRESVQIFRLTHVGQPGDGDVIYVNNVDLKEIFNADTDGDHATPINVSEDLQNSFVELFEDKDYINTIKKMDISKFKKGDMAIKSSLASKEDWDNGINGITLEKGAQGMATNAQAVSKIMGMKEVSFEINGKKYFIRQPDEKFLIDFADLTPEAIDEYNKHKGIFRENGDSLKQRNNVYVAHDVVGNVAASYIVSQDGIITEVRYKDSFLTADDIVNTGMSKQQIMSFAKDNNIEVPAKNGKKNWRKQTLVNFVNKNITPSKTTSLDKPDMVGKKWDVLHDALLKKKRKVLQSQKGGYFLETTYENMTKNVFMMAVQNKKTGHLSAIGWNKDFLKHLMFRTESGGRTPKTPEMLSYISALISFFNFSPFRQGKTINQNRMSMKATFEESQRIEDFNSANNTEKVRMVNDFIENKFNKNKEEDQQTKLSTVGWKLTLNDEISAIEYLLGSVSRIHKRFKEELTKKNIAYLFNSHPMLLEKKVYVALHQATIRDLKNISIKKLAQISGIKTITSKDEAAGLKFERDHSPLFYSIYEKAINEKFSGKNEDENLGIIDVDYNTEFLKLGEDFQKQWDSLSDGSKFIATLRFLTNATKNGGEHARRILQFKPAKFMYMPLIVNYAKIFYNNYVNFSNAEYGNPLSENFAIDISKQLTDFIKKCKD
jgi:hypothetical protein